MTWKSAENNRSFIIRSAKPRTAPPKETDQRKLGIKRQLDKLIFEKELRDLDKEIWE